MVSNKVYYKFLGGYIMLKKNYWGFSESANRVKFDIV